MANSTAIVVVDDFFVDTSMLLFSSHNFGLCLVYVNQHIIFMFIAIDRQPLPPMKKAELKRWCFNSGISRESQYLL
jgi:hypothetical protein